MLFWVLLLAVASLCGAVGARLAGRSDSVGCLGSIALGFIGAALGGWIARSVGMPSLPLDIPLPHGRSFPTIYAVMGSALFVAVLGLFRGPGRHSS